MNTSPKAKRYNFSDLLDIMARLRDPDAGCPWDLQQDFSTIAPYTLEEAYEVADAIDRGDMDNLREELGDLLLQPVYHAQMASETKVFDIHDVIHDVAKKMIDRHPHVFGDAPAASPDDVNAIWEQKKGEARSKAEFKQARALDGVPNALPSLLRAQKLQSRAAKVGFEWNRIEDALNKLEEEMSELRDAIRTGNAQDQKEEIGDVLFVMANVGRMLGFNSEEALRQCNRKFERRFRGLEDDLKKHGAALKDCSLEDMTEAWNAQKIKERGMA